MKKLLLKNFISPAIIAVIIIFSCSSSNKENNSGFDIKTIKVDKGVGSIEVGDFNNDSFPDIAVANTQDSSITILLGDGKGNFTNASGSPFFANRFPNDIGIADFNKDG